MNTYCHTSTMYILHIHKKIEVKKIRNSTVFYTQHNELAFHALQKYKQPSRGITGIKHSESGDLKTCILSSLGFPTTSQYLLSKSGKGA